MGLYGLGLSRLHLVNGAHVSPATRRDAHSAAGSWAGTWTDARQGYASPGSPGLSSQRLDRQMVQPPVSPPHVFRGSLSGVSVGARFGDDWYPNDFIK